MSVEEILQALYHLEYFLESMPKKYAIRFLSKLIREIEREDDNE